MYFRLKRAVDRPKVMINPDTKIDIIERLPAAIFVITHPGKDAFYFQFENAQEAYKAKQIIDDALEKSIIDIH